MPSVVNRVLGRIVSVRRGEGQVASLMFAYSFLAMTAYNIIKPVTRSKFITALGSDNLPYVQLVAGVLIGLLMHLYTKGIRRLPRKWVLPVTQGGIVVVLVTFWGLLQTGAVWPSVGLYFMGLILGVLLISQFWTLANDIYDARQAKRLFGFIGGGASLGGAMGAGITAIIVDEVGANNLLLVSAAVLAGCTGIVIAIVNRQSNAGQSLPAVDEQGVSGREALRLLRESPHIKVMALVIGFAAGGGTIVEQQLNMAAEAARGTDTDAIAAFLAQVTFFMSAAGFVVQVVLTRRIHTALGLTFALLLLPVGLGSTAVIILLSGALWAPSVARVLDTTFRYTIDKTTREILFLPLPADLRYRAKPFIDVTTEKLAKALAAIIILVLIKPWGLGLDWRQLSYASITAAVVWAATALIARREYQNAFRQSIGTQAIAPLDIRTTTADAATIETLVEELSSPDEASVLYAIDMLEAFEKRKLVSPLLLHHQSPRVRARTLRALAQSRSRVAVHWSSAIERMVQDEDVDVRAAALAALAELSQEERSVLMHRHLADREPRVAVTAAIALANSGQPGDIDAAEQCLMRLIAEEHDAGTPGRREAATALAHIHNRRFRSLLVPLIYDRDPSVAGEAIRSARALGVEDGLFVPALLSLLGHRAMKDAARDALVGYGEDVVDALGYALLDEREHPWVRRHIPATLARIGTPASMTALTRALDDSDGFLRYKTITAIETIKREHPDVSCPRPVLEALVLRETSRYYNALTLQQNLVRLVPAAESTLLAQALGDKLQRSIDRIYRLIGLLYRVDDVAAARQTIEQGEGRRRAAAVEYLDNLLGGTVRKRVMPIVDDSPIADKVHYANAVLKSRPRDLDDTLAQLIHDADPVLAACAIHFVGQQRLWALADDIQYVVDRRQPGDDIVYEAASWSLTLRRSETDQTFLPATLPAIELVDRIRAIPLFSTVTIDELFRIVESGDEVRHAAGHDLRRPGTVVDDVHFLIEGQVQVDGGEETPVRMMTAPNVFGVEEVLEGARFKGTLRAIHNSVCFRIAARDFLAMVSESVVLAQGLFRLLLARRGEDQIATAFAGAEVLSGGTGAAFFRPAPAASVHLAAVDKALLLRQDPLLSRATAAQLLALTEVAPEITVAEGTVLFELGAAPVIYHLLDAEVVISALGGHPVAVRPGATVGVAETLAGVPLPARAIVSRPGRMIRLYRDELFSVLADHPDLMQSLFRGVLAMRNRSPAPVN